MFSLNVGGGGSVYMSVFVDTYLIPFGYLHAHSMLVASFASVFL